MIEILRTLKLLSDLARLRILMLLSRKELCVCQMMGILEISQSLISKNLHLLAMAGLVRERKEGKLVYYSISRDMSSADSRIISLLTEELKGDTILAEDIRSLRECEVFQKKAGRCDMKTFREFIKTKRTRKPAGKEKA